MTSRQIFFGGTARVITHCSMRRALSLALPVAVLLCSASFTPLDPFVATGAYARSIALAADCSRSFLPAIDTRDDVRAVRAGPLRLVGFERAGIGLAYGYRTVSVDGGLLRVVRVSDDSHATDGATTRVESFETPGAALSVASKVTAAGCTRLVILVTPAELQVGVFGGSIVSTASLAGLYAALGRDGSRVITVPSINPDTIRGVVTIRVYVDGVLKPNQPVTLWTDSRAQPGRYGQTVAHEHVIQDALAPTIRLQGQPSLGARIVTKTDGQGESKFWIKPGYRGGPEAILASTDLDGTPITAVRAVIVRHRRFVDFAQSFGYSAAAPPRASDQFPFMLVGSTTRHVYNHWLQRERAPEFRAALLGVWQQDAARAADITQRHYFQLNDMSTEYGGAFKLDASSECASSAGSHATHNVGLDFDIGVCYSRGADGLTRVPAADCDANPSRLHIDERVLVARVIGDIGGAIYREGEGFTGTLSHFHVRVP